MRVLVGMIASLAIVASGCGDDDEDTAPQSTSTPGRAGMREVSLERAEFFADLDDVAASSTKVVYGSFTGASETQDVDGLSFAVMDFSGRPFSQRDQKSATETIKVRMLDPERYFGDEVFTPKKGVSYALFLEPFTFSDQKDTGQHVVVGIDVGAFEQTAPDQFATANHDGTAPADAREVDANKIASASAGSGK